MFVSVLRTALRSLRRNRGFALLNVAGLALGMACVILIALYVQDERAVDAFHERADRIARLDVDFIENGEVEPSGNTLGVLAPTITASMPEVEAAVRFTNADPVMRAQGEAVQADRVYLTDNAVFEVFTYPFRSGDPATALAAPGSIVLTASLAQSLFGGADAQGQTVQWTDQTLTVTGVMADVPRQSHLPFDGLISLSTVDDPGWYFDNWFSVGFATYVLLREGVDMEAFDARLPAFTEATLGEVMAEEGTGLVFHARPLESLYLTAERGKGTFGSLAALRILSLVALFVLIVAGVNFTNLATARSLDRAREVGVRKSLGAARSGLAVQFLAEAVVLSLVALGVAVVLAQLAMPVFRDLADKPLALVDLGIGWLGIVALAGVTGLLAGAYPALVLSGFDPASVLKGRFASGHRGAALRRVLVVAQFGVSVALIAATGVVFSQLNYMQSKDLGIDLGGETTQLLLLPFMGDSTVVGNLPELHAQLEATPGVVGSTASLAAPTFGTYSAGGEVEGPDGLGAELSVVMYMGDASYADVYGLTQVAGRRPDRLPPGADPDTPREYALSVSAVRKAGYADPEAALGKTAEFWGVEGVVVGVIEDFHVEGLQRAVEPIALMSDTDTIFPPNMLTVRVQTAGLPATLAAVEAVWADLAPTRPFEYSFLDEDFAAEYVSEQQFGRLFAVFAGLAIVIACLGLFGLAAHAAATRTKEIGVRRVLGATVGQVVVLLSRSVVALVVAGVVLAVPVVVVGMSRWLSGFAYRVDVGWQPLVVAASVVLLIALVTVGGHAVRAAVADPVRALRSD
ncbi:MAG: ABC transporter permease [Bacteroidota bacterium]